MIALPRALGPNFPSELSVTRAFESGQPADANCLLSHRQPCSFRRPDFKRRKLIMNQFESLKLEELEQVEGGAVDYFLEFEVPFTY